MGIKSITKKLSPLAIALATSGCLSIPEQRNSWLDVQPAVYADKAQSTLRLEGGVNLSERTDVYGFVDFDTKKGSHTDLETFYGEVRINHSLGGLNDKLQNVGVAAEVNSGTNYEDTIRMGVTYSPQLGDKNFTTFKFLPFETNGDKGAQVGFYTKQNFTERLSGSLLLDYNFKPNLIYSEPELSFKLNKQGTISLFGQARIVAPLEGKTEVTPVVGFKFRF